MSSISIHVRGLSVTALVAILSACAPSGYDSMNGLGVMPLRPPTPVWLGAVRGTAALPLSGAAAVTPSQTPGWAHVLISLGDITSGGVYAWSLHNGSCASQGGVVGPADRYGDFTIHADGSGAAEALVPLTLSQSESYAVVATPVSPAAGTGVCADLTRTSM